MTARIGFVVITTVVIHPSHPKLTASPWEQPQLTEPSNTDGMDIDEQRDHTSHDPLHVKADTLSPLTAPR